MNCDGSGIIRDTQDSTDESIGYCTGCPNCKPCPEWCPECEGLGHIDADITGRNGTCPTCKGTGRKP